MAGSSGRGGEVLSRGASEERPEQAKLYLSPTLELPQIESPTGEGEVAKEVDPQQKSAGKLELKSPKRFACFYCKEKFSTKSRKDEHMLMELEKKMQEGLEKKRQKALEKERKREDAKMKRKLKRKSTSLSVGDLENSKSEILKVPRSLAMLEDKLSHNFLAEGR